ncbi:hypothetical protein B0O99DRAFT_701818 [Bisporella sp. PMI_857]|nr:hypothetical protein B0O99DRAFT_701818 [Bisporella sp. PMI_857]
MLRRSQRKSKGSCAHCKKRHIKCDESRPDCANCTKANLQCSFTASVSPTRKNIEFITSFQSPGGRSHNNEVSLVASANLVQHPVPPTSRVNLTHLKLFHHFISNANRSFFPDKIVTDSYPDIVPYMFSHPFLCHEILAISALHLSTCRPERFQLYRDESVKLQTKALRLFNDSVKKINSNNLIPAFLYSGLLGLHFISDTFSIPNHSFDCFIDRLVQSIRLLQGFVGQPDEIADQFERLRVAISKSANISLFQTGVCEAAIRQLSWVYCSELSSNTFDKNYYPRIVTSWPVMISTEYTDLLINRNSEALVILSYYAILLHKCRKFWAVGSSGQILFDALEPHIEKTWKSWLAWPKSIIHKST